MPCINKVFLPYLTLPYLLLPLSRFRKFKQGNRGYTPICKLYRYVPRDRVWFLKREKVLAPKKGEGGLIRKGKERGLLK